MLVFRLAVSLLIVVTMVHGGQKKDEICEWDDQGLKVCVKTVEVYEGKNVRLDCKFHMEKSQLVKTRPDRLRWSQQSEHKNSTNGWLPLTNVTTFSYILKNVSMEHQYRCEWIGGQRSGWEMYFEIVVKAKVPRSFPRLKFPVVAPYSQYNNELVHLDCNHTSNTPSNVNWFRKMESENGSVVIMDLANDKNVNRTNNGQTLTLSVTHDTLGDYFCVVCNMYGCVEKEMKLEMMHPPVLDCDRPTTMEVEQNEEVVLYCKNDCLNVWFAGGNHIPKPQYFYELDGHGYLVTDFKRKNWDVVKIRDTEKIEFWIQNISLTKDLGTFYCQVTDLYGDEHRHYWYLKAKNPADQLKFETRALRAAYTSYQRETMIAQMVYFCGGIVSFLLISFAVYLTWCRVPKREIQVLSGDKNYIESFFRGENLAIDPPSDGTTSENSAYA